MNGVWAHCWQWWHSLPLGLGTGTPGVRSGPGLCVCACTGPPCLWVRGQGLLACRGTGSACARTGPPCTAQPTALTLRPRAPCLTTALTAPSVSGLVNNGDLMLKDLSLQDDGLYQCTVANHVGYSVCVVEVRVSGRCGAPRGAVFWSLSRLCMVGSSLPRAAGGPREKHVNLSGRASPLSSSLGVPGP